MSYKAVFVSLLLVCIAYAAGNNLKANGKNVCKKEIPYMQTFTEKRTVPHVRTHYTFCWNWRQGFRCLVSETYYTTTYVTSTRQAVRIEYSCCSGWKQDGVECTTAICTRGCSAFGKCIQPEQCECDKGFSGTRCDNDVNECSINNGGCSDLCSNFYGSFVCECPPGYVLDGNGATCSDHDECLTSSHGCEHVCVNKQGSYECSCSRGYELIEDGLSCKEINECDSNPCEQICFDLIGSFDCACNEGYSLRSDITSCLPLCSQGCGNGGYCSSPGTCSCPEGWSGNSCEIPICSPPCNNGACASPGTCICDVGWEGQSCDDDTNECLRDNGDCDDVCTNTAGSYECSCKPGYLLSENQHSCSDHDECLLMDHGCDFCVNTLGSYECICPDGYTLVDGKKCIDNDECSSSPCEQTCINTNGSFYCACAEGFVLDSNGYHCSDVDECKENVHKCEHICENTNSWYKCACREGFELESDGLSCSDVNECADDGLNNCEQNCSNIIGSFLCSCFSGYTDSGNGCEAICIPHCQNDGICGQPGVCTCPIGWTGTLCEIDIDECSDGSNQCDQDCINVPGGYLCTCHAGYTMLDDQKCADIDECENGSSKCQQSCINVPGSYSCSCEEGFLLDTNGLTCSDHDECLTSMNDCDYCANSQGSFSCYCPEGYYMEEDGKTCLALCHLECANGGRCIAPNTCECTERWRGEGCNWQVTKNHWTLNYTGCQCYFDHSRFDCACCNHGGCQCTDTHNDKCVQCGYGFTCEEDHDDDNRLGVDGWTSSETGCPCLVNNTNDLSNNNCACCQNGGCPCGEKNPHRCAQCGQLSMCSIKRPWE